MNKLLRILSYSFFLCITVQTDVNAGQSATKACLDSQCDQFELHVTISSESDEGLSGGLGIIATLADPRYKTGNVAFWTVESGWTPLIEGELIKPVDKSLLRLPPTREFAVFRGNNEYLCKLSNGHSFNLFAWHAGLKSDQVKKYHTFLSRYAITGWQSQNFMNSVLFFEANKQKKVGKVYSHTCNSKPELK